MELGFDICSSFRVRAFCMFCSLLSINVGDICHFDEMIVGIFLASLVLNVSLNKVVYELLICFILLFLVGV